LAAPLSILGWAEAKGGRALVLVQSQPGSRLGATELALLPTLKLGVTAHLHGMILVDHIILYADGSATHLRHLRQRSALVESQAFSVQLRADLEDLALDHRGFGLLRVSEPST
jgi:hypothetical protein